MTLQPEPRPQQAAETPDVSTPSVRSVSKKSLFWVAAFVFILIVGAVTFSTAGAGAAAARLGGTSPNPNGAKAVVEVLRDHGVTVHLADSLAEARAAASDTTTVFLYDGQSLLSDEQLAEVGTLGGRLVVAAPDFDTLQQLAPQLAMAGAITDSGTVVPGCTLPFASRVEAITGEGQSYRIIDDSASGVTGCFPAKDNTYSLVQVATGAHTTTVIGTTAVFSNETIVGAGNAALALNLLGESDSLVWYLPTLADLPAGEPTLAELSPDWLPAVTGLLALVVLGAAIWRGRRFGPLVVERLPVVVPASETMEGRARLYQRATARSHAIDQVRIGTIGRLATELGLSHLSGVDEVVSAVAARIGAPVHEVQHTLVTWVPATDGELIVLSDALLDLEKRVAETGPGRRSSPGHPSVTIDQPRQARAHGTEQGE
ncbi:DUF4350 domain-containing protein [Homoserinimonas sp. OAct 916]|uniref:DUF4350 domain-containing protein n=1 Tax=Homoserinimonas sp. OAct 916 TaxID=2211450 RepID=UPI000DBE1EB2|nr:DUF4350 domain-containing protein [Homoserinimonas sp. OAct 916]